jgi:hypothetical protein
MRIPNQPMMLIRMCRSFGSFSRYLGASCNLKILTLSKFNKQFVCPYEAKITTKRRSSIFAIFYKSLWQDGRYRDNWSTSSPTLKKCGFESFLTISALLLLLGGVSRVSLLFFFSLFLLSLLCHGHASRFSFRVDRFSRRFPAGSNLAYIIPLQHTSRSVLL